ncbi:NT-3 growth factor receptor [Collichthys lucidus]|uniref:NT-3 growth factor receptor n=1 Tax=Collichthys lucidus TaxID=240159 RepID=A0A4U5U7N9_COLLU|nr:NT-3 growth factor receptor [Collichthys lucidus]
MVGFHQSWLHLADLYPPPHKSRHIENWTGLQTLRDVDMELYTGLQRLLPACSLQSGQRFNIRAAIQLRAQVAAGSHSINNDASGFDVQHFSECDTILDNFKGDDKVLQRCMQRRAIEGTIMNCNLWVIQARAFAQNPHLRYM